MPGVQSMVGGTLARPAGRPAGRGGDGVPPWCAGPTESGNVLVMFSQTPIYE
ncbi:hypothetical protein GCM10012286_80220 [Streptomyces lasiicapitis]|uniref:Uncharacterized protein n=1 Tax=Streptomyces lasiicapitis TaxID=1923961 RepID=A0ABQ2MV46_9ACTN|nr:hypothetical protein GCM10012286_80220 [Streptomyces lasiicapitis]